MEAGGPVEPQTGSAAGIEVGTLNRATGYAFELPNRRVENRPGERTPSLRAVR